MKQDFDINQQFGKKKITNIINLKHVSIGDLIFIDTGAFMADSMKSVTEEFLWFW